MPTPTYTPLANVTLGSSAATVSFSSINQGYRDLVCVVDSPAPSSGYLVAVRLNSDTTSGNYSSISMTGDGSSTYALASASSGQSGWNLNEYGNISSAHMFIVNLMDYSAVNKHKSGLSRTGIASGFVEAAAHRWASTSAVTTVTFGAINANFPANASFALYGIASA